MKITKKNVKLIILANIILFFFFYFLWIYPIKREHNYSRYIYKYENTIKLEDLKSFFKNAIKNISLSNNQYLSFQDDVNVQILVNDSHSRGTGNTIITATYNSEEDLIQFLKTLNIDFNIKDIANSSSREKIATLYVSDDKYTVCYLFLKKNHQIEILFTTWLPYKMLKLNENERDEIENYYLSINEENFLLVKQNINKNYIKIIIIMSSFNLVLLIFNFSKKILKKV